MDILNTALKLTTKDRHEDYGDCNIEFEKTAKVWSELFNTKITPTQVILAMIALKCIRQVFKNKRDNWVDIAGYARLGDLVTKEKNDRRTTRRKRRSTRRTT